MHMIVFIMSLKRFFRDGESRTEASEYYKRHIHMLHYGICGYIKQRAAGRKQTRDVHKNRTTGVVPQQHVTENEEEP